MFPTQPVSPGAGACWKVLLAAVGGLVWQQSGMYYVGGYWHSHGCKIRLAGDGAPDGGGVRLPREEPLSAHPSHGLREQVRIWDLG